MAGKISETDLKALIDAGIVPPDKAKKKKRSKYGNTRVMVYGKWFDAKKEADRYIVLKSEEDMGLIKHLKLQVPFELTTENEVTDKIEIIGKYMADFTYHRDGEFVVEDVKGKDPKTGWSSATPLYKWKKRHMKSQYGIDILET
jgi:hypothetical protein